MQPPSHYDWFVGGTESSGHHLSLVDLLVLLDVEADDGLSLDIHHSCMQHQVILSSLYAAPSQITSPS
jgi:hypothetical protein